MCDGVCERERESVWEWVRENEREWVSERERVCVWGEQKKNEFLYLNFPLMFLFVLKLIFLVLAFVTETLTSFRVVYHNVFPSMNYIKLKLVHYILCQNMFWFHLIHAYYYVFHPTYTNEIFIRQKFRSSCIFFLLFSTLSCQMAFVTQRVFVFTGSHYVRRYYCNYYLPKNNVFAPKNNILSHFPPST